MYTISIRSGVTSSHDHVQLCSSQIHILPLFLKVLDKDMCTQNVKKCVELFVFVAICI